MKYEKYEMLEDFIQEEPCFNQTGARASSWK
jgi:hypothetical protein